MSKFYLPDLGEGLQGAEIIEWKIKPGDKVLVDQLILVVETAKAIVEIPSPVEARIGKIHCKAGDMVDVGSVLLEYTEKENAESPIGKDTSISEYLGVSQNVQKSVSVVGSLQTAEGEKDVDQYEDMIVDHASPPESALLKQKQTFNAPPSVRVFAEKIGLTEQLSEKSYGMLTEKGILEAHYKKNELKGRSPGRCGDSISKLTGARKVMAQTMSKSHEQIPAVTLFDDANICTWKKSEDITLRCIKALVFACMKEPILNAWFDEEALGIQLFEDIHLGVAVNSAQGLYVPVIRKVQTLDDARIREIMKKQIQSVHDRTIKPQKLLGATISLSNFGSLSGRYATPIIVPPQVSIMGVGKIRDEPVVENGQIKVGRVMPISLSFDHRAASGAEAARFMQAFIESLES